jgi:hypothetical protein
MARAFQSLATTGELANDKPRHPIIEKGIASDTGERRYGECPNTGRELSTGIEMDAATFAQLPDIRSHANCPICSLDHVWTTREAWLGNPPPSLPALPWLFINNRSEAND